MISFLKYICGVIGWDQKQCHRLIFTATASGNTESTSCMCFPIIIPFIRYINYPCRHNISREIYFCTNPTHMWLGKTVGRNVERANEIRADINTRALLSRSSTDICTVYGADVGLLQVLLNLVYLNLQVVQRLLFFLINLDARYTSQLIVDMVGIAKASVLRFWRNILTLKIEITRWAPH